MYGKLTIVGLAVLSLSLPELALAKSSSQGQSSALMQASRAGFVHWWSMGSAGPEPMQGVNGEKNPRRDDQTARMGTLRWPDRAISAVRRFH
jgi:hypothetical protein